MMADVVIFKLGGIELAGAGNSPVAHNIINGRIVVEDGRVTTVDLPVVIEKHNMLARELVRG